MLGATIKTMRTVSGRGLFSGAAATVRLEPAGAGTGLVFRRSDLDGRPLITADTGTRCGTGTIGRHTVLGGDAGGGKTAASVWTVEHILAACAGLGITDLIMDVDAQEIPILDGSAREWVAALLDAGVRSTGEVAGLSIAHAETLQDGDARIELLPGPSGRAVFEYHLDYGAGAAIAPGATRIELTGGQSDFARLVAPARTFCTLDEALAMKRAGLFAHLSARDMLVIGPDGPVDNAYRMQAEPAAHKLLDLIGDLRLAGPLASGTIRATRSGHALNHRAARALAAGLVT